MHLQPSHIPNLSATHGANYFSVSETDILGFLEDNELRAEEIVPYARGVASRNFRATGNNGLDLTVRCDFRRSLVDVQHDRYFSEVASQQAINVPRGPWCDGHIRDVAVVARPTVSGTVISDVANSDLPKPALLADILNKLHSVTSLATGRGFFYSAVLNPSDPTWDSFELSCDLLKDSACLRPLIQEGVKRTHLIHRQRVHFERSPVGMIHGDFNPANILRDGDRIILIDWEKACLGPIMSDIVQAIYYCSAHYGRMNIPFAPEFADSYLSRVPIDRPVIRSWMTYFPAFIFMRDTISASFIPNGYNGEERRQRSLAYLIGESAPRFRHFLENEKAILSCI